MEQMTLFDSERPYKYIMDTSSILSQKPGETHTRLVYKSQWERIEEYMRSHSIVTAHVSDLLFCKLHKLRVSGTCAVYKLHAA